MTASQPDNEAFFHAARDIPDPDRRREYIREACGGDEARIADVEALSAVADGPDSLLDRSAAANPMAMIDQPATESPGTAIGPYKLVEPIGEGGMGSVWKAQQTEPVKRLVAVRADQGRYGLPAGHRPLRGRAAGNGPDGPPSGRTSARWNLCRLCAPGMEQSHRRAAAFCKVTLGIVIGRVC